MEFLVLALFPRSYRILAKLPTLRASVFFIDKLGVWATSCPSPDILG